MSDALEIYALCDVLNQLLKNKEIQKVLIEQAKCSNVPQPIFQKRTKKALITRVYPKGKWIILVLSNGENILITLGVGGQIDYFSTPKEVIKGYQAKVIFKDKSGFTVRFRWFGRFYLATDRELIEEQYTREKGFGSFEIQTSYLSFTQSVIFLSHLGAEVEVNLSKE